MRIALASISALALAAPAFATPVEDFRDLIADYEASTPSAIWAPAPGRAISRPPPPGRI